MTDKLTKRCPFCGEKILSIAIKCRYCGSMLTETPSASLTGVDLVKQALGDRYEILEEIGRGGMATVYKAVQKSLERTVALKVIHHILLHDAEFVARFHREAKLCASLNHPNIVHVYDEGEVSGVHFMAMEYLEGQDLRQLIRSRGKLTPEQTLQYLLPVAEALDYAHGRGLIHRDIKSANIFVCNNPDTERRGLSGAEVSRSARIVLMDFGIAHAAAGTQLTRAGTVIGTPEYMSPEQADGRPVDHRTDLYSLGVVMYECMTGRVPFTSDTAVSTIYKVINEKPDESGFNFIPKDVKTLTLSLLSKNPEHRPKSGEATAQAIRLLQQGKAWQPPVPVHTASAPKLAPTSGETIKLSGSAPPKPKPAAPPQKKKVPPAVWAMAAIGVILVGMLIAILQHPQRRQQKATSRQAAQVNTTNYSFTDPFHDQMVFVKGGTFTMGCTNEQGSDCFGNEEPTRRVTVSDFYIGKYPVTQAQWRAVMGVSTTLSDPSHFKGCDDCPVERVSWNDVQEFIKKLNQLTGKKYRLPTEAEWEYAARGGNQSRGFKYAGSNNIDEVAWYWGNSTMSGHMIREDGRGTFPVGRKNRNELGLYDMSGNVWEWCEDDWHDNYNGAPSNSSAWIENPRGKNRVLRGGSWDYGSVDCRVSNRFWTSPVIRLSNYGFRLAHSVD